VQKSTRVTVASQPAGQRKSAPPNATSPTTARPAANFKNSSQAAAGALSAFFAKRGRRKIASLFLAACLAAIAGCGSNADPNRLPVFPANGQIAYHGMSLRGAFVVLHPQGSQSAEGVRPRGHVADDGKFSLSTYETSDGAPAGDYKVTVECRSLVKKPNGDVVAGPNVLPKQYSRPETSPISVRIASGDNALAPIVLK
jgi:hypothetical protein